MFEWIRIAYGTASFSQLTVVWKTILVHFRNGPFLHNSLSGLIIKHLYSTVSSKIQGLDLKNDALSLLLLVLLLLLLHPDGCIRPHRPFNGRRKVSPLEIAEEGWRSRPIRLDVLFILLMSYLLCFLKVRSTVYYT